MWGGEHLHVVIQIMYHRGDGGGGGGRWVQPGWGEGRGEKAYNCY